jgi:AraC-like DNA-binding protein
MTADSVETSGQHRDLVSEISSRTADIGANVGLWPGLTMYRFTEPTEPQWERIGSLALGIVAQGRKAVMVEGQRYVYDQFHYLVLRGNLQFQCQVLAASARNPFLSFVLEIDPALVRRVSAEMAESVAPSPANGPAPRAPRHRVEPAVVSGLDEPLVGAVLRFLRSLPSDTDRRVLAPLYLQEVVYRVLQREQFVPMLRYAAEQAAANPVAGALTYISAHIAEPVTVAAMAEQVSLSPSAFTRTFRDVTGRSPYQYVKDVRLGRARELLIEGRLSVTAVSLAVGYTSVSHFIKEFRSRFGTTPRDFGDTNSLARKMRSVHAAMT